MVEAAAPRSAGSQRVEVDGHVVKLTNLDKVLYPETGTTKADVIAYYAAVADVMLPHLLRRPVTRKRWVDGVGTTDNPGTVFFEKNLPSSAPQWVDRVEVQHRSRVVTYPIVSTPATLAWFGQVAALEVHVPQWRFTPDGEAGNPDRLVLDLDPGPGVGLAECAVVAREARTILRDVGLDPVPVTSGSKGIHLYSGLDGTRSSDDISAFAKELARALEADHRDLVVSSMAKSRREGKVLIDWSQNSASKTTVAPYSLRGRARPTVAAPRTWREIASSGLRQLEFDDVVTRLQRRGDLFSALLVVHSNDPRHDRLHRYRSMRDAERTPEPVPIAPPQAGSASGEPIFVVQEHHARRTHWDFRLQHEGVLVSWALPKGVPESAEVTRLAVPTEDHPLEYAEFVGTIPRGEYGAGEVTMWDSGTYTLEKWLDGREVIVTLHSAQRGIRRVALIRTGDEKWIMRLLDDASRTAGSRSPRARRTVSGTSRRTDETLAPMLATLANEADIEREDEWAFEMKWDGIRVVATVDDHAVQLRSRNGVDVTASYPELGVLADAVDGSAVLDGEVVALDRTGRPSFSRLQRRMGVTSPREVEAARASTPVTYMVFDVLEAGNNADSRRSCTTLPYDERRSLLLERVTSAGAVQVPEAFHGALAEAMRTSLELGLEGLVAKRRDSRYRPGRRSTHWLKLKHERSQSVIVCGWRPGKGDRADRVASLLLAVPDGDGLRYVGRVGTGFNERARSELVTRLGRLQRSTAPVRDVPSADASDARWVTPKLVGDVAFAEWTESGRLRHATWRGWRPELSVEDVSVEST